MAVAAATHHSYDRPKTKVETEFAAMYRDDSIFEEPHDQSDDVPVLVISEQRETAQWRA